MNMWVIGISHKTAPIEVREKFYLKDMERTLFLSLLKNDPQVAEALVLSTCNRIEVYVNGVDGMTPECIFDYLFKLKQLPVDAAGKKYFYIFEGNEAVRHLLQVATGLDSLVLGEKQILGQVKKAIDLSREMGMLGKTFNILANIAVRAGKKAQSETEVGYGGMSMSWAAVTMAQTLLTTLEDKSVLLIGAGKMSKLAANQFVNKNISKIYVMNRTHEKAVLLAEKFGGTEVAFWDLKETLFKVDVCICAASAPHYLINKDLVAEIMTSRKNRPLILIDISMPRNIEPAAVEVDNVTLLAIDDLARATEDNIKKRNAAVLEVEAIVERKILEFRTKLEKAFASELLSRSYIGI